MQNFFCNKCKKNFDWGYLALIVFKFNLIEKSFNCFLQFNNNKKILIKNF